MNTQNVGKPATNVDQIRRAKEQQAVLNRLRAGQGITGAKPANPIIGGVQALFGGAGAGTIPTLNAARLGGQEVLMNRGGWDSRVAGSGPINVGGQTWYPAQSGQDLVYKRAPGNIGGQYGSILSGNQLTSPAPTVSPDTTPGGTRTPVAAPPAKLSPEEQAYNAERSRIAQLTAQNPEFQNVGQLRNDLRDKGMEIWAAKYGNLAKQVKPGQSGYEAIQRTLYPGGTPAPELSAESEAMLNAIAPANEFGVRPDVTPMPGQLPSFGSATEAMFNAITAGGTLVTPMPQKSIAATPQDQAQGLAETYKKALLSGLGNDPLGIAGIRQYGQ